MQINEYKGIIHLELYIQIKEVLDVIIWNKTKI